MNTRELAVVGLLASTLTLAAEPAAAQVAVLATLTSDDTSIVVGQSITFQLTFAPGGLPPSSVDCNSCDALLFAGIGAQFHSGDGQVAGVFGGVNPDGTYPPIVTFTYLTPGDYVASVDGYVWADTAMCSPTGCGERDPDTRAWGQFFAQENITVGVPEPTTWAMLLTGFALLGAWQWRLRHSVQKS